MRQFFSLALRILGASGGAASLAGLVYFGWSSIKYRFLTPPPAPPGKSGSSSALGQMYDATTAAAHAAGKALDSVAQGVVDGLAVACALALAFFAFLFWLGFRLARG